MLGVRLLQRLRERSEMVMKKAQSAPRKRLKTAKET
jgi:hypothetical protein